MLTHWGWATHICVNKVTIIGSDNGLSPGRRQAILWTSAGILLIAPMGTNFSEILIENFTLSFKKMHLKMSSGKWRPFCLELNVLRPGGQFIFKFLPLKPEHYGQSRPIPWWLIDLLLASPGHRQQWYCACWINWSLSSQSRDLSYLFHLKVEKC